MWGISLNYANAIIKALDSGAALKATSEAEMASRILVTYIDGKTGQFGKNVGDQIAYYSSKLSPSSTFPQFADYVQITSSAISHLSTNDTNYAQSLFGGSQTYTVKGSITPNQIISLPGLTIGNFVCKSATFGGAWSKPQTNQNLTIDLYNQTKTSISWLFSIKDGSDLKMMLVEFASNNKPNELVVKQYSVGYTTPPPALKGKYITSAEDCAAAGGSSYNYCP